MQLIEMCENGTWEIFICFLLLIYIINMMASDESHSDSDTSYHEEDDECDSSSEYSFESDLYESDDEAIECGGGWKRVGDAFADKRPDVAPTLVQAYSGVNPTVGFSQNFREIDCLKKFITDDMLFSK